MATFRVIHKRNGKTELRGKRDRDTKLYVAIHNTRQQADDDLKALKDEILQSGESVIEYIETEPEH